MRWMWSGSFSSSAKYDSGTGWPSFLDQTTTISLKETPITMLGYPRTEVMCARCGGHLGHVFEDGPPYCLRYCINSVSLGFVESKQ